MKALEEMLIWVDKMVKRFKKIFSLAIILLIGILLTGCQSTNVIISGPEEVAVGDSITLSVEGASDSEVVWLSSDEEVATVKDGVVTGIKEGNVVITAKVNGKKGKHSVKVSMDGEIKKLFCGAAIVSEKTNAYDMIELALAERKQGNILEKYNPFDYDAISVYGIFTSPSGKEIKMPAFWYRDYTISLNTAMSTTKEREGEPNGLEMVNWVGDYEYRLRFQPTEAGSWSYRIYSKIGSSSPNLEVEGNIDVASKDEDYKGLVQIDKSNNRTFVFEDGSTFMPIGENMGWWVNSSRKTYDYAVWFAKAYENNMNITRIWMAPWGLCLHWGKSIYDLTDRLNCAARLDRILEYADQYNIYFMLTLINHGQFSSNTDAKWQENPYNKANGGILERADQFFTNTEAKRVYKNELMYIIGRYGYSDHILCWELFNEVDWTDSANINAKGIKNWHEEMATFLKNNDPYNHLVTTSYKTETGLAFSLDNIDFVCPHNYGYTNKNICDTLPSALDNIYNQYNKPVLQAEVGIDWENGNNNYRLDPTGIHIRQSCWAGMMGGGASGAMVWWWDSYVHPYDLYYQFRGAGAYAKMMDLRGNDYTQLRTLSGVNINNGVGLIGYRFNDRIYGYVYDKAWKYNNQTSELANISVAIPFSDGNYSLYIYNAVTGDAIDTQRITVSGGKISFSLPAFTNDIAFIVKK